MNWMQPIIEVLLLPFELLAFFSGYKQSTITSNEVVETYDGECIELPQYDKYLIEDSIKALGTLGMTKTRANEAVMDILAEFPDADIEQIIKTALKRK